MMERPACLKALAAHRTGEIVVAVFQAAFEWLVISPSELNYTFVGAMGQAAPHGLGLALAFPRRRVLVLDGDGSLLMNLGCLVTIACVAPENLIHFVLNNGTYETSGGQPVPGCGQTDFAGFARAAGYPRVHSFEDLAEFEKAAPDLLASRGPVFAELKVVSGPEAYPEDFSAIYSTERRAVFKRAVQRTTGGP